MGQTHSSGPEQDLSMSPTHTGCVQFNQVIQRVDVILRNSLDYKFLSVTPWYKVWTN